MLTNKRIYVLYTLFIIIGVLMLTSACDTLPTSTQEPTTEQTEPQTQLEQLIQIEQEDSIPHDAAFHSSSFLLQMDDLKAINMAANYLKEIGETVNFHETYIEYHDAEGIDNNITLQDGEVIDYMGDYLEVRLYHGDQSDELYDTPCEHCKIVYISQDGKVLGQSQLSSSENR